MLDITRGRLWREICSKRCLEFGVHFALVKSSFFEAPKGVVQKMLMKTKADARHVLASPDAVYRIALCSLCLIVAFAAFAGPLLELVSRWNKQEEYSYGYLIPFITAWLLWSRRDALVGSIGEPSWTGLVLIAIAVVMRIIGELSALYVFSQVGFLLVLLGIALCFGGRSLLSVVFVPILFLGFAIPLPWLIDASLSWRLQMVSSQLGVAIIRLFQIPVFLQGNVIDLGVYKLQVVEACSGLRYLYPLLSLSFLAAYLFQAPIWQRALIFLSAIPITIGMNSLRIGLVGVMVDTWGPQDADGFLHLFEGWVIFIACAGILIAEMSLLARFFSGKSFLELFHPPEVSARRHGPARRGRAYAYGLAVGCLVLVGTIGVASAFVTGRQEIHPDRKSFASFPKSLGEWKGRPSSLSAGIEEFLGLTDYILSDYAKPDGRPVNFYVAYYASQRSGISPHSPSVCIPGSGWRITDFERVQIQRGDTSLPVNRALITRGRERLLVYYWYEERGVPIASEYLSKLLLLKDAILENRTDGALIRLTTPIYPDESDKNANKRLQDFVNVAMPTLAAFLPKKPETLTASTPVKAAHR